VIRPLNAIVLIFLGIAILLATPLPGAKHETWVEVRSPNFIVVSNAGEKQARAAAIRLEQMRAVLRQALQVAKEHESAIVTVLAVKDEDSMKALLPEYWAKGHVHPAGIFIHQMNQYFAAIQLDAPGLDPYHTIYHEYFHSLATPYYPNLPVWVSEGLAEFYGNSQISDSAVELGRANAELIAELRQGNLIPLDVLFKVDYSSPYYNEQNKTSFFYAESWALTHYLMLGDKQTHKPMLDAYLDALAHGATQQQAATNAFGDLHKLQMTLQAYVGKERFYVFTSGPPAEVPARDLHARELPEAEVDAYRGGFVAVKGKSDEAIPILERAVKLDPKLALAYQYLGFAEYQDKKPAEALADFTRAIELSPKNSLTRFLRAYLASTQGGAVGDDVQMEEDLRAAIAISPEFAPPYGVLAMYVANQGTDLPEALKLAQKAQALEPGNAMYQIDLASVLARMNRFQEARNIAMHARSNAANPNERAEAERFLAYLDQVRQYSADDSDGPQPAAVKQSSPTSSGAAAATGSTPDTPDTAHTQPDSGDFVKGGSTPDGGTLREATGTVAKLSCMGGLKFELVGDAGKLTLHIKPGTNLPIRLTTRPSGPFNACTALQGQRVKVSYQPDDAKGKVGTLESLTLLSGAGRDANGTVDAAGGRRLGIGDDRSDPVTISAEGIATHAQCDGNELTLRLTAGANSLILHARDATRVQFEQDVAFDTGDFQPCTQLNGRALKITFVVVSGKDYDGEIQAVEVEK
jgi:tetratricopeptide (TPR) repeat protein